MQLAERLTRLGSETAFAVSAEAAAHAAKGNTIYPFHLGDMNIPTPGNVVEATIKAMKDGKTGYCPNYGIAPLREALAEDINRSHGTHYRTANVAIQPGGKPVISKFILAMMNAGDEVLYPSPGYPIYESQIEFHGGKAIPYRYLEGNGKFGLAIDEIARSITPRTKLLILNDPQNPTGGECSQQELQRLARIVREQDLFVLCDEAYFDVRYEGRSISLASLEDMEQRCLILYAFSKKFAMTGWRLGAAVGPAELIDVIAKLSVNDESCTNHFIQYGAIEGLTGDPAGPAEVVRILKQRRDKAVELLGEVPGLRCLKPSATFYLYPNVTQLMQRKGMTDYETFRKAVLHATGVSFCTRCHFGRTLPGEKDLYIRLAYSGIDLDMIEEGLASLKAYAES